MAFLEARRHKDSGDEQHPSLLVAHSPLGSTLADGAAHDAKSLPDRWRRAAGKTLSAALFVSMWVVPPLIHRAGFRCDACPRPRPRGMVLCTRRNACACSNQEDSTQAPHAPRVPERCAGREHKPTNVRGTDAMPTLTHLLSHADMYVTSRRAKVGSAYHVHKDLLALYSGRLTLANATFLLLYTAWLQWTPRIVDHCRTIVECVLLLERILLLECVLYRHGYNGLRV